MIARAVLMTLTSLMLVGLTTRPAAGADYGISFHYSSCRPSSYNTRYYSSCYPTSYAHCDEYYAPVFYDACYPATYRTTYTRSDCYARPVRHARASIRYSSGHRTRHYRPARTYRHSYRTAPRYRQHYSTSRYAPRVYTRHSSGLRHRSGGSYIRNRGPIQRYGGFHRGSGQRHQRTPRMRISRR
jgi:hypothetical protein